MLASYFKRILFLEGGDPFSTGLLAINYPNAYSPIQNSTVHFIGTAWGGSVGRGGVGRRGWVGGACTSHGSSNCRSSDHTRTNRLPQFCVCMCCGLLGVHAPACLMIFIMSSMPSHGYGYKHGQLLQTFWQQVVPLPPSLSLSSCQAPAARGEDLLRSSNLSYAALCRSSVCTPCPPPPSSPIQCTFQVKLGRPYPGRQSHASARRSCMSHCPCPRCEWRTWSAPALLA